MINHARTLLLNKPAVSNIVSTETAGEFVPAEFTPVALSSPLKLLRKVLLGGQESRTLLNMRVNELMGYVHQTEIEQYAYMLDPRVTYWPKVITAEFYAGPPTADSLTTMLPILEMLGEPVFLALFGSPDAEPYTTFKHLWFDHPAPVYKLAGLTMAIVYRTEELRKGATSGN